MDEFLKKVHDGSSPMDGFLKEVQDSSSSIETPPDAGRGCQLGGKNYERLRKLLSELGPEDDFGGLRQEPRDGQGAIWVCEKHRKYSKETRDVVVMKWAEAKLRALSKSKSQNWAAGPWPYQAFWHSNKLFQKKKMLKKSSSYIPCKI